MQSVLEKAVQSQLKTFLVAGREKVLDQEFEFEIQTKSRKKSNYQKKKKKKKKS